MSLVWLIVSLCLIFYGIRQCRVNAYSYSLQCKDEMCTYTAKSIKGTEIISIHRSDLKSATQVRLNNGEIMSSSVKPSGRNGYSISILYNFSPEEGSRLKIEKLLLFSKEDMGRRVSRSTHQAINKYITREKDSAQARSGCSVTVVGILISILGLVSSILSCVFGQWSDPEPRHRKKSS